jgi:two-component system, chemotaxis family, response regulator Rcp1
MSDQHRTARSSCVTPIEILLVEDSPSDIDLTREALEDTRVHNNLSVVTDGVEALAFLRCEGKYAKAPHPDLILLDLNLPKKDGREVLAEIKADPQLKQIPVIVLTTSSDERDVQACYKAGASSYIQKPVDLDGFMRAIERLNDYWFEVVILPRP